MVFSVSGLFIYAVSLKMHWGLMSCPEKWNVKMPSIIFYLQFSYFHRRRTCSTQLNDLMPLVFWRFLMFSGGILRPVTWNELITVCFTSFVKSAWKYTITIWILAWKSEKEPEALYHHNELFNSWLRNVIKWSDHFTTLRSKGLTNV